MQSINFNSTYQTSMKSATAPAKGRDGVAFSMDVVIRIGVAVSSIAVRKENTHVSGPDGPLTRRYAPTTATPCRDHSDSAK